MKASISLSDWTWFPGWISGPRNFSKAFWAKISLVNLTHWRNSQISLSGERENKKIVSTHLIYQYTQNAKQKKAALRKRKLAGKYLTLLKAMIKLFFKVIDIYIHCEQNCCLYCTSPKGKMWSMRNCTLSCFTHCLGKRKTVSAQRSKRN